MGKNSIDILNNIRLNASQEFKDRIPVATQNNIATIGQAFQQYTVLYNEFCEALINKIGRTILEQKMFKNSLARFKSGSVVSPHDVEEIFIEMAKAEGSYDKDGKNPLGRRQNPDVYVIYHRQNRQDYYAISIGDIDFMRVFRSEATLDTFIKGMINSVYSADEYDEWLAMKNVLATYGTTEVDEETEEETFTSGYFDYEVKDMSKSSTKRDFAKDFVKTLRKAVQDVSFASTQYNVAGVKTWSKANELVLLVNKDVLVEVDVEQLATAFNTSKTDMKVVPTIIPMDDFGTLTDTYALLLDKDWFRIYDTLIRMEPQRNAQGLFTNYFFHHHQILSASTFKNAVRLKRVDMESMEDEEIVDTEGKEEE